jgi:RNA polymerase I-specific transcription initiation factor RRN7
VEIYPAVRRLATMLEIDFSYPRLDEKQYGIMACPEIQLMSLIVICTKLSQPFDNIPRYPDNDSDPTIARIDWSRWSTTMTEKLHRDLKRGEEIKVKDFDVWDMNAKKMDDYLDWYQRTWIDDRNPKSKCYKGNNIYLN